MKVEVSVRETNRFRKDIVGLRAIAIILVILFHLFPNTFPYGWGGVDLFFVISGYVVTLKIHSEIQSKSFSIGRFYRSRILRLFPAFFVVLVLTFLTSFVIMTPRQLKELGQSLISIVFASQNLYFYRETGYFGALDKDFPLLHTWSLAVEEQFYFILPLFLLYTIKKRKNTRLMLANIACLSFLVTIFFSEKQPEIVFYFIPFRLWELLIGVLLALSPKGAYQSKRRADVYSVIGVLLLLLPSILASKMALPVLFVQITTVCGAYLLLGLKNNRYLLYWLMTNKLFLSIGLASYSLYLTHQPIITFYNIYRFNELEQFDSLIIVILVVLSGLLLRKYVEIPFQKSKLIEHTFIIPFFSIALAIIMFLGIFTHLSEGFKSHYYSARINSAEAKFIYGLVEKHTMPDISKRMKSNKCFFNTEVIDSETQNRFNFCKARYGEATVLIGDSHAINVYNILFEFNKEAFLIGFVQGGCRPAEADSYDKCSFSRISSFIQSNKDSIGSILFHQSGSYLIYDANGVGDSDLSFKRGKRFSFAQESIKETLKFIDGFGAPVVWLGPFIESRIDLDNSRNWKIPLLISNTIFERFKALDSYLQSQVFLASLEGVDIRYESVLESFGLRPEDVIVGDCLIFNDKDHLTECGEFEMLSRARDSMSKWLAYNLQD